MAQGAVYLLAGGRGRIRPGSDPAWVEAIRGIGTVRPSLAYVGAASGDSAAFRLVISRYLKGAGAGKVLPVKLCGRRPDLAAAREALEAADAIFLSGGGVEEGMAVLDGTGTSEVLRALAAAGKPFIGISAGSILLGRWWVRWRDPEDEATAERFPCLGIASLSCDTHDEGSGWCELRTLAGLLSESEEGWGLPSGCLLVAGPDPARRWVGPEPLRLQGGGASPRGSAG